MQATKGSRSQSTLIMAKGDRGGGNIKFNTKSFDTTGTIDSNQNLILDEPLPITGPKKVRVLILLDTEDDIHEEEWLIAASCNPAFEFLDDPEEDIYTLKDRRPFDAEG